MADNFWERMSGMSKQSYGSSLYDAKEMKKWQKEQDKWYKDLGTTRDRYGRQSSKFMGKYDTAEKEADRYRGMAETTFGEARGAIGRATGSFGRSEADVNRARQSQMSANAMMADRDHYSNLKRRAEERRYGIAGDRREMESIRGRLGKPTQDTGMTQRLMDAFKGSNESSREMMEANTAQLAKSNPAAAARMQAQFNEGTLKSLGQLKQQGMVTDQQLSDNKLTREAGMLMDSTALYGQQAAQDQMTAGYHQQQIQNFGAAGTQALNTAGAEGNIARGYLSQGSQYGQIGAQYGGLGSQLDARARTALGAGMDYEGMGYSALQDQTSIANRRVERQDKFRMSDAAARARVDSYNRSRGARGIGNVMKVAEVAARVYAAGATGGGSELAIAAMKAAQAKQQKDAASRRVNAGGGDPKGSVIGTGNTSSYGNFSSDITPVSHTTGVGPAGMYGSGTSVTTPQWNNPPRFSASNEPITNPNYGMSYSSPVRDVATTSSMIYSPTAYGGGLQGGRGDRYPGRMGPAPTGGGQFENPLTNFRKRNWWDQKYENYPDQWNQGTF